MKKYYHIIIEQINPANGKKSIDTRREIISPNASECPAGWRIVGVCGYHEKPERHGTKKEAQQ